MASVYGRGVCFSSIIFFETCFPPKLENEPVSRYPQRVTVMHPLTNLKILKQFLKAFVPLRNNFHILLRSILNRPVSHPNMK